MTREEERLEQAKFYKDKGVKDPHVHFLRGAEWADSTMIDKACEWLKEQLQNTTFNGEPLFCEIEETLEDFRKVMKGD